MKKLYYNFKTIFMYDDDKLLRELESEPVKKPPLFFRGSSQPGLQSSGFLKKFLKTLIYIFLCFTALFVIFYLNGLISKRDSFSWVNSIPIISQIKTLAESSSIQLKGESRGRVNILFLGEAGQGYEGARLTDTIIVFSVDTQKNKVALLSIPRDLSVPIENSGWRKINSINSLAESSQPGSGGVAASQTVANVLQAPLDYYVRINFEGFKKIIDYLGGVEVDVANTFDDYTYPIAGREDDPVYVDRYEHLHIEKGRQKMDGELALKYARSRHAYGAEGTDFARAARQQKIIQAIKDQALSAETLLNPKLVANIIGELKDNISTNMKIWEMIKLWNLTKHVQETAVISKVLSNQPNGLLMDTTGQDGAYLLLPRTSNFSEVQYLFDHIFEGAPENVKIKVSSEQAKVKILNGTWINGLAGKTATDLEKFSFNIVGIGNCSRQNFERSVIYDLTFGAKKDSLELLKEKTGANVSFDLPDWLKEDLKNEIASGTLRAQPDLILILGQDAAATYND